MMKAPTAVDILGGVALLAVFALGAFEVAGWLWSFVSPAVCR